MEGEWIRGPVRKWLLPLRVGWKIKSLMKANVVSSLEKYLGDKINRIWELIGCVCMIAQNWQSKERPGFQVTIAACNDGRMLLWVPF